MIADLFAGPGGWDCAARWLDLDPIGFELDADACATRSAAGLRTIRADLDQYRPPTGLHLDGLIGSPPCPAFSQAGDGRGRAELPALVDAIGAGRLDPDGFSLDARLVLTPFRWIADHHPTWVALEQVPPVLPVWQAATRWLASLGYQAWAGVLCAADYGVPQTRRRAILMAHAGRRVTPPVPSHAEDPIPTLFGDAPARWVTMADALDLPSDLSYDPRQNTVVGGRVEPQQPVSVARPARTITGGTVSQWVLDPLRGAGLTERHGDRQLRAGGEPAPTVTTGTTVKQAWQFVRPATTIACDSRVWPPGHKINQGDVDRLGEDEARARYGDRAGTEAVRITVDQAAALQSFPPGYPWHGNKGSRARQVGNAVPPLLARAVLAEVAL